MHTVPIHIMNGVGRSMATNDVLRSSDVETIQKMMVLVEPGMSSNTRRRFMSLSCDLLSQIHWVALIASTYSRPQTNPDRQQAHGRHSITLLSIHNSVNNSTNKMAPVPAYDLSMDELSMALSYVSAGLITVGAAAPAAPAAAPAAKKAEKPKKKVCHWSLLGLVIRYTITIITNQLPPFTPASEG
jgi:hypothetical protein